MAGKNPSRIRFSRLDLTFNLKTLFAAILVRDFFNFGWCLVHTPGGPLKRSPCDEQERLEATAGQAAKKGAVILAVHEDWAADGAGNGLGKASE